MSTVAKVEGLRGREVIVTLSLRPGRRQWSRRRRVIVDERGASIVVGRRIPIVLRVVVAIVLVAVVTWVERVAVGVRVRKSKVLLRLCRWECPST